MYKPLPDIVTVKNSSIHGLGLYATKRILKDCNLGVTHVKDSRFENNYIRTPLGGFFNHSTKPNCEIREVGDFLMLVTIKDISPGEELTARYTLYNPEEV